MNLEKEIIMKAARDIYQGGNLENYLEHASKKSLKPFSKKVQDRFLKNLEKEHPGKNFIIGQASLMKANLAQKILNVLKGESISKEGRVSCSA